MDSSTPPPEHTGCGIQFQGHRDLRPVVNAFSKLQLLEPTLDVWHNNICDTLSNPRTDALRNANARTYTLSDANAWNNTLSNSSTRTCTLSNTNARTCTLSNDNART